MNISHQWHKWSSAPSSGKIVHLIVQYVKSNFRHKIFCHSINIRQWNKADMQHPVSVHNSGPFNKHEMLEMELLPFFLQKPNLLTKHSWLATLRFLDDFFPFYLFSKIGSTWSKTLCHQRWLNDEDWKKKEKRKDGIYRWPRDRCVRWWHSI